MVPARFWRAQLTRGGPAVGVKIWHDFPRDPLTDQLLTERPAIWRCAINGVDVPIEEVAPQFVDGTGDTIRGTPCTAEDYELLASQAEWDRNYDPKAPAARPREKVNLNTMKPIKW